MCAIQELIVLLITLSTTGKKCKWVDGYSKARKVQAFTSRIYESNTISVIHMLVALKSLLQTREQTTNKGSVFGGWSWKIPHWADHDFLTTKQVPKSDLFMTHFDLWISEEVKMLNECWTFFSFSFCLRQCIWMNMHKTHACKQATQDCSHGLICIC